MTLVPLQTETLKQLHKLATDVEWLLKASRELGSLSAVRSYAFSLEWCHSMEKEIRLATLSNDPQVFVVAGSVLREQGPLIASLRDRTERTLRLDHEFQETVLSVMAYELWLRWRFSGPNETRIQVQSPTMALLEKFH